MSRRAFVLVLDACGVGELPDAPSYGDAGANTLANVAHAQRGLRLALLQSLGLGSILDLEGVEPATEPVLHGRLHAQGAGKDSTAGHWELMGVVAATAPPTYPHGLPPELLEDVTAAVGSAVICNSAYNGIAAIEDYGAEHQRTGHPILYTSQDSVLQLAAHVDVLAPELLYRACEAVRSRVAVGRVIARPFDGVAGSYSRTDGRHDYALAPPTRSYLQELGDRGVPVHGVGKVEDLFAGVGIDFSHPGADNEQALEQVDALARTVEHGLIFVNLIDTDQRYGHRKDTDGFHRALREFDVWLAGLLALRTPDDLIIVTADHGCDPAADHSDHTREHAPLLASFRGDGGRRHDGPMADVGASVLDWICGTQAPRLPGQSFI